jgi:hypothetical protein
VEGWRKVRAFPLLSRKSKFCKLSFRDFCGLLTCISSSREIKNYFIKLQEQTDIQYGDFLQKDKKILFSLPSGVLCFFMQKAGIETLSSGGQMKII